LLLYVKSIKGKGHFVLYNDFKKKPFNQIMIEDLYEYSQEHDEGNMYNYFQSLIRLFSEICLQRNYKGINPLKKQYPLNMVIDCMLNDKILYPLRCEFAKLLLNLHLDVDPYEELAVPVKSRIWEDIGGSRKQLP
jgi:hypothetical protein